MAIVPSVLSIDALCYFEEFLLCVAVSWVALADVGEMHVDELAEAFALDVRDYVGFRVAGAWGEDLRGVRRVEGADNMLAVLAPPATVAAETSCCGAAPV